MPGVRIATTLALTSVGVAVVLAGCGADPDRSAADPTPGPVASSPPSSASPSASASASPSDLTPRPERTQRPERPERPQRHKVDRYRLSQRTRVPSAATGHLLPATRMPTVGGAVWTVLDAPADTPAAGAVGGCQKTGMAPIGAMEEVRRSFRAPGGLAATQLVARFPDARSAVRAHAVLAAWRDDCERRVAGAAIGALEPVAVPVGSAVGYRASYASPGRTTGLALLRSGEWLTMVEVSARDAYPTHWDPARVAVRRASRTF